MQNTAIMGFPDTEEVAPRYDQKSFDIENQINTFVNVVSPKDQMMVTRFGSTKNFFHLGIFDANSNTTYQVQILITVFIYFNRRRNNG
jgi:hypothetical protein